MERSDKMSVGILGKKTETEVSRLIHVLEKLFHFSEVSEVNSNTPSTLLIPICYPFPNKRDLEQCKVHNISTVGVVIDSLITDSLIDILLLCSRVVCFSRATYNKLLSLGLGAENVCLLPYPLLISEINQTYTKDRVLIPARRLKNDHVDVIINCLYKASQKKVNLEIVFLGSEHDEVSGGFSKYLLESVKEKGFSSYVKFLNFDFHSLNASDYKLTAKYTVLLNGHDQNQVETLNLITDSLFHRVPVLTDTLPIQVGLETGIAQLRPRDKETLSQELFSFLTSESLQNSLDKEIESFSSPWESAWSHELGSSNTIAIEQTEERRKSEQLEFGANPLISLSKSIPRVLIQNRANAFSQPGGDTVVMERILKHHSPDKIEMDVCLDGSKNPKDYDLIHLFNFAIREITEQQAKEAVRNNKPYAVTTLYEDWPVFYNQMAMMYMALKAYVENGQPVSQWVDYQAAGQKVEASQAWDNSYAAHNAECLIATGKAEELALGRDYNQAKQIISIPLGCEVTEHYDGGDLFFKKYGLKDFVLCVGRMEWRKNQLMLLKALEEIDVPIVFAASSFTYQPEYDAVCRAFKRKGKTIFLSRLSDLELASAYQAARIHVLPSWYELPGLVSLEAARYGTPVVVSNNGTTRDYLGEHGLYCNPADAFSIKEAVLKALTLEKSDSLSCRVKQYTWKKTVENYECCYNNILNNTCLHLESKVSPSNEGVIILSEEIIVPEDKQEIVHLTQTSEIIDSISAEEKTIDLCLKGDKQFKNGDFKSAKNSYELAIQEKQKPARAYRSLGALCLYLKEYGEAENYFRKALELDQFDSKALLGKGAVLWEKGEKRAAFNIYRQASELQPNDPSVVLYLVNSAYEINALAELEECLRRFLRQVPEDANIQYCLAGCYFKQEKYSAALGVLERLLTIDMEHKDALELKSIIEAKLSLKINSSVEEDLENSAEISDILLENPVSTTSLPIRSIKTGSKELAELEELKSTRQYQELVFKVDSLLSDKDFCDTALDHFDVLKAEALGCMGEVEASEEILLELRSRNVQPARVLCDLGALALAKDDCSSAIQLFEEALGVNSSNDNAFAGLAMCAQAEGRLEDAWTLFEESLRKNSQNIQAIYGLVQLGYEFNRLPRVESFLREYLELKPIDISILYSLAGCLYAQGKSQEAVGELKNILLFDPQNEPALELMERINVERRVS